ncbi:glycerate dehydrogenase [Pseudoalteromonas sp. NBT06-2]|uniref:D-2-hydroxyacid dehydrogenase n=1 Tax=Pseudoalteromonas sp. NBT06-2 TaxID=2025950 RepID=UPI000BA65865|nr:D-2-hydroxyacid dehydrogenase [Pseudoalteromonas sp. NBT06-2]PAJ75869.1 glycerate dehydrogenase [Pseudoalteromonas sp. NBT06-2]
MNIVILDAITLNNTDFSALNDINNQTTSLIQSYQTTSNAQLHERCKNADIIITNKICLDHDDLIKLPKLKLICIAATGTNNINLVTAKSQGIAVTNVAGYSTASVVQHTFTLLLNLISNSHKYIQDCQNDLWQKSDMFCMLNHPITELEGKTLAIIGYGALGKGVENIAKAFGMNILICERKNQPIRAGRTEFSTAMKQADIISIHTPLTEDTHHLISANEFSLMKSTAILINTARGGIVDEIALVEALKSKMITAAATDVLSIEPAQDTNPLIQYKGDNLIITPHIAWGSKESIARLVKEISLNITAFYNGESRNRVE